MEKQLIKDKRLTTTMNRIRSGRTQLFREKNPHDMTFISSENADVILEHERPEMFAELIDGQWYWVNGCGACNGHGRSWETYIECDTHNVCVSCGVSGKDAGKTVWGGSEGWQCNSCHDDEKAKARAAAFEKLDGKEIDCSYTDDIVCPHCGSEISSDDVDEDEEIECHVCDGELKVEVGYSRYFSTSIVGKRITS